MALAVLLPQSLTRKARIQKVRIVLEGDVPSPYDPPSALERYFYDAIWPGYVPASRCPRRASREHD